MQNYINNDLSDKNTVHSYLPIYNDLFRRFRNSVSLIEVGISEGGSMELWSKYFHKYKLYGVDILDKDVIACDIQNNKNITLHTSSDAYNKEFVINNFYKKNIKFDIAIDDGPHTLESMKLFIGRYLPLVKNNGILIIEDIPIGLPEDPDKELHANGGEDFIKELMLYIKNYFPYYLKYTKIYDLRKKKNRYDDVLLVINLEYVNNSKNKKEHRNMTFL